MKTESELINKVPSGSYSDIPLTEEWLLKFGKKLENGFLIGNLYYIDQDNNIWLGDEFNMKIDFVHQLQNLYFALTGTELEIK